MKILPRVDRLKSDLERKPRNYWYSLENKQSFINKMAKVLQVKTQRDWKCATSQTIIQFGGLTLLEQNKKSIQEILKSVHPELNWTDTYRYKVPQHYWSYIENQRQFLDKTALGALHVCTQRDWKSVTNEIISQFGGSSLIRHYKGSIHHMMTVLYPELDWFPYDRLHKSRHFWNTLENQRYFLERLASTLQIQIQRDWKRMTSVTINNLSGCSLIQQYPTIHSILNVIHPEFNWTDCNRHRMPKKHWGTQENQLYVLTKMAILLEVQIYDEWQQVYRKNISKLGGLTMQKNYPNFLFLLQTLYPSFNWHPLSCVHISQSVWNSLEYCHEFVAMLQCHFDIQNKTDWYRLSNLQVARVFGRGIPKRKIIHLLQCAFPTEEWNFKEFSQRNKKSRQRWLLLKIKEIFPGEIIFENFSHEHIKWKDTGIPIELDVFLPDLNLAFEFHGEQHYVELPSAGFASLEDRRFRDDEKVKLCLEHGIKLVVVPFWWDDSVESLVATIEKEHAGILDPKVNFGVGVPIQIMPVTLPLV